MSQWKLIWRSLLFYSRSHLGAALGAVVGAAILTGALVVGDSIRESLRELALSRLGQVEYALSSNDRFLRSALPGEMAPAFEQTPAALLHVQSAVANEDNSARANAVHVYGVDAQFQNYTSKKTFPGVTGETVVLNSYLAEHLKVKVGDTILFRFEKPSLLSREVPISPQQDFSVATRLKVASIVKDDEAGRFGLQANQLPPYNAFVAIDFLQKKLGLGAKANLILTGTPKNPHRTPDSIIRDYFKMEDAELELRDVAASRELRSARIFLDDAVDRAAENVSTNNTRILTYFVNELRVGTNTTPYSMVCAATTPLVPAGVREDEILINEWLANDLHAKAGDTVQIRYFVPGHGVRLEERTNTFKVRAVVLMRGLYADRELMPEFPGIAKAEKTENWDAGFTIDMKKIRPKDEQYWKEHRGTPKAFITLAAGQKLWTNRFGNLTAIRWPQSVSNEEVQRAFAQSLDPATIGFRFQPVREQALAASSQGQDFAQLFIGFSFFLIAAALILISLLFQFSIEQRAGEVGTLLALGLKPKTVRRMLLVEGILVATFGSVIGVFGGAYYAKAMLHGLTTIWRAAVGTTALHVHTLPATLVMGGVISLVISALTIAFVLRKHARRPARELLAETLNVEVSATNVRPIAEWVALLCGVTAVALVAYGSLNRGENPAGIFFGAGALLLISLLASASVFLKRIAKGKNSHLVSLTSVAVRGATRRRRRSLAVAALLATGTFLVVAIGAFRLESQSDSFNRNSGTGGFAFVGETTVPVVQNLNERSGREFFGIDDDSLKDVQFVSMRIREGDDASCLNLNRAQQPRLLGVRAEDLQSRGAFQIARVASGVENKNAWLALKRDSSTPENEVPAIGDAASIQYALGKKVGDTLNYTDDRGNRFKVRIVGAVANSILQGSLLIDESEFVRRFPNETGYRMFLIDAPSKNMDATAKSLSRGLRDVGLELTPAATRLAAFNAVQNTYLNTFQILGGLGLVLGTVGLGVVVLRNVFERRSELALLTATGFRPRALRKLVFTEHGLLLVLGLIIGVVSALIAIAPAFRAGGSLPHSSVVYLVVAIFVSGLAWTIVATSFALRGELLKALRNE